MSNPKNSNPDYMRGYHAGYRAGHRSHNIEQLFCAALTGLLSNPTVPFIDGRKCTFPEDYCELAARFAFAGQKEIGS